jgi:D-alanine-D-alanine ligase
LDSAATQEFAIKILQSSPGARLFIKVDDGFDSTGLSSSNVISNLDQVKESCRPMIRAHGPIVLQRYLSGREFTVAVLSTPIGPRALHPVERVFSSDQLFSPPGGTAVEKTVVENPMLITELRKWANRAYVAVGGDAWGRVDIRCDSNDRIHVLEVNNTASFAPTSYWAISAAPLGYTREIGLEMVIRHASKSWTSFQS